MVKKEKVKKLKRVTDISAKTANSIKGGKSCSCSCSCNPSDQMEGNKSTTVLNTFAS